MATSFTFFLFSAIQATSDIYQQGSRNKTANVTTELMQKKMTFSIKTLKKKNNGETTH